MTSYKGRTISYDAIGNPLTYYVNNAGYTYTWSDGRRLTGATKGVNTYTFTYNDEGIRTSKTVNGVKHTYVLDGSRIVSQQWSDKLIIYLYDETGSPIGMQYRTSSYAQGVFDTYYFEKNLQGDIIAVYSASGTVLVYYDYDAWGNFTYTFCNNGSSTPVVYNPFRYRGYYYDADLRLYYLNSRYYDSNTGRFISSDRQLNNGLLGLNQYAYCENNPVRYTDYDGRDADENCTWDPDDGTIDLDGIGKSATQPTKGNSAQGGIYYNGYQTPIGGGGITDTRTVNGITVEFGHGGRHLNGDGLTTNDVNTAIANDVINMPPTNGKCEHGIISLFGYNIQYSYFTLSATRINIGTYYVLKQ